MTTNTTKVAVKAAISENRGFFWRQLIPLALIAAGVFLFHDRVLALDFSLIEAAIRQVSAGQWGLAIAATGASYWAVGRYDGLVHGLLGTGIAPNTAMKSGMTSIAIAQFAGFGILTGALVRWRLLSGFDLMQSLRVSLFVSATFLAGWACVTATSALVFDPALKNSQIWAMLVLAALGVLIIFSLTSPKTRPALPSLKTIGTILSLVAVDLFFAGVSLYVLLPAGLIVAPGLFITIYLLAFGAGLVGGTPGGIGPFEITLVALLNVGPTEPLLASVLAYRLVYYLIPASLATIALIKGPLRPESKPRPLLNIPTQHAFLSPETEKALWQSDWAEANLLRQGDFGCMTIGKRPTALVAPLGQTLVMLGAPLTKSAVPNFLKQFSQLAQDRKRGALLYKSSAKFAVAARKKGWRVLPVVREAWIDPTTFSTKSPSRRQLRRFIRKACSAGVEVSQGGQNLPYSEMLRVSEHWARDHKGERGFSMGYYDEDYIGCQRVFLARQSGHLIAFLTLHETRTEWAVDLMRSTSGTPCGTMHSLICAAIEAAAESRITVFSLAAVPHEVSAETTLLRKFREHVCDSGNADGLLRFKNSFAPHWRTLYAIAPGRITLFFGLFEVLRAIRKVRPSHDIAS